MLQAESQKMECDQLFKSFMKFVFFALKSFSVWLSGNKMERKKKPKQEWIDGSCCRTIFPLSQHCKNYLECGFYYMQHLGFGRKYLENQNDLAVCSTWK